MKTPDNLRTALALAQNGYTPVAIRRRSKVPAERWRRWLFEQPTEQSIRDRWEGTDLDVAILCKDLLVFDLDADDEALLAHVLEQAGCEAAPVCRTPSGGFHVHTRALHTLGSRRRFTVRGKPIDLLTGVSLSIVPPSEGYSWLTKGLPAKSDLPCGSTDWAGVRGTDAALPAEIPAVWDMSRMHRRAAAWLSVVARESPAVSGRGGHNATYRVTCRLTHPPPRGFGMDREAAIRLMLSVYNPRCHPPWRFKEIVHKVDDALKRR
jgi:hypothetical protein